MLHPTNSRAPRGGRWNPVKLGLLAIPVLLAGAVSCDTNPINTFLMCPPIDLVFVMDTSGSMDDEAQALCDGLAAVENELTALGANLTVALLGITEDSTDRPNFSCLTDNVLNLYGAQVPNSADMLDQYEDWGPATSVLAANYPWQQGALRVIVPISDEGPQNGDPCDTADDVAAIDNAIAVANANSVVVSPIAGTDATQCVIDAGERLAMQTGGQANISTDPNADLAGFIYSLVEAACQQVAQ